MQLEPSTSAFADMADAEADEEGDATPEVRLVPEDSSTCAPLSRRPCIAYRIQNCYDLSQKGAS